MKKDAPSCWIFALALPAVVSFGCDAKRLGLFEEAATIVPSDPVTDDDDVVEPSVTPPSPIVAPQPEPEPEPEPEPVPPPAATPPIDAGSGLEPLPATPSPASTPGPVIDAGPLEPEAGPLDATAPRPDFILIDDFEDSNRQAIAGEGWWYITTDFTAGQQSLETVIVATRPGFVLRASASNFTDWGVIVGLDMNGEQGFFDATPTNALRFYAQAQSERTVLVRILQQDSNSFGTEVTLTTEWAEFVLPFGSFEGTTGMPVDPSTISHLQLFFGLEAFEVRLDDVAFVTL